MASMILSGDTSGTITLSAPSVAGSNTATLPASTGNVLLDTTVGVCRAWVNFNGTGTVAIRASFNVSSITHNATGDYTVNFTNAMQDANYSLSGVVENTTAQGGTLLLKSGGTATSNAIQILVNGTAGLFDTTRCNLSVFR